MTHKKKSFRSAAPVWAAFVIPIVWLAVLMAGCYAPGMTIFDLVAQFSEVTQTPFSLHWTPYTMKFIGIFLLLYGGAILFYYTGQKNTRPGEEHGSASWGSVRELDKKYRDKDAGKNVILTQHLQMSMNGKLHRRNLLQIIVGGSGSGKTRFLAKPNLMLYLLHEAPVEDQNMETILYMIENGGAKEEDDDYQSPLDLLFEALEEEQPDHIAVRQYHIFKQAAGVICSK